MRWLVCAGLVLILSLASGCAYFSEKTAPERMAHGYLIVLPGIEGRSVFNSNVAHALASEFDAAVEVHDWTTGVLPLFLVHLRDLSRNRREAERLAEKIARYQDAYPGRPVYLVGHSGGAGLALLTLESLPEDRKIDGAILLAAAVSRDYDLRVALSRTKRGIWNFHSPGDVVLLVAGTTVAGTFDGRHEPSAGAYGFRVPENLDPQSAELYRTRLRQVPYELKMLRSGNYGGHFGPTTIGFTRDFLVPAMRE